MTSTFPIGTGSMPATFLLLILMTGLTVGCGTTQKAPVGKKEPVNKKPPAKKEPPARKKSPKHKPGKLANPIDPNSIPETPREMRGVWIATVDNIDWPSQPGLSPARQKAELRARLDKAKKLNLNTIFFQVRPAADALYQSPYEPWSYFLTGKQGRAPHPYFDPLKFAIKEAHQRGLALQAWFNPFRAYHPSAPTYFAPKSVQKRHPHWVVKYGSYYWLNPGIKAVRDYSMKVILNVARRYDIDGVHLDDYFYPYPVTGRNDKEILFPDQDTYQKYLSSHGYISRGDWRRQNINRFVEQLHDSLRKSRPRVLFGISPFGIWRPGQPPQIKGYDAYEKIYADSRKWLRKGWVDYLAPQLYWGIDQEGQSFPVLLKWWEMQNFFNRHLWPGLYTNKVDSKWDASEIIKQIQISRKQQNGAGEIHFSMKTLMNNPKDIDRKLRESVYNNPALVPASPWLSNQPPQQPEAELQKRGKGFVINLNPGRNKNPRLWVVKIKYGNHWSLDILPGWKQEKALPNHNKYGVFQGAVISAVDRLSDVSAPQMLLPVMKRIENDVSSR